MDGEKVEFGARKHVGPYELGQTLGEGTFGKVKLGVHIFTQEKVAVKLVKNKNVSTPKEKAQLDREKKILLQLDHPNIVKLVKVVEDHKREVSYMIFEYVNGGELFDYIVSHGRLREGDARKFFREIISAMEYVHYNLIIHRDLKPENLLLQEASNGKLTIKITDFGLANIMKPGKKFSTFCGSLHYACPEILRGEKYLGPGVDIWSMGVILYCLVVGRQPWDADSAEKMVNKIMGEGIEIPDFISDDCVDLILKMLRVNERDRIPLSEMRTHPFVMDGYDSPPQSYLPDPGKIENIDESVMKQLVQIGFMDNEGNRREILDGKKTQLVATYKLLLQKKLDQKKRDRERRKKRDGDKKSLHRKRKSLDRRKVRSRAASVKQGKQGKKVIKENPAPRSASPPKFLPGIQGFKEDVKTRPRAISSASPSNSPITITNAHHNKSTKKSKDKRRKTKGEGVPKMPKLDLTDLVDNTKSAPASPIDADGDEKYLTPTPKQVPHTDRKPQQPRQVLEMSQLKDKAAQKVPQRKPHQHNPIVSPRNQRKTVLDYFGEGGAPPQEGVFEVEDSSAYGLFDCSTTSSKSIEDIKKEIVRVLDKLSISYKMVSPVKYRCVYSKQSIRFIIEIVSIAKFKNLKGVKLSRLAGDIWAYKLTYEKLVNKLRL